jgi:hypothetical protein
MITQYYNRREFLKTTGWGLAALSLHRLNLKAENQEIPRLFDVRANEISREDCPLIQPWKHISLDPDYAGSWIISGDVDGDGLPEIISARNVDENDNHYTSSVVVHRLDGRVLWRWGDPQSGRNILHHDVACQIHDWDGDGKNEVVIATRCAVLILDGYNGAEKHRFAIPENASDCIIFANLSGTNRATDILVKSRYEQIWAYNPEGELLWTISMPGGYRTAHQPVPVDIDGDGKDEIIAGYALLNPDGTVRWDLRGQDISLGQGHLDCARIFQLGRTARDSRIVITCCGDNCIAMLDGNGKLIWSRTGHHFESIDVGRVCPDIPGQQVIVDIDHRTWGESPTWILDEAGEWLGQIITDRSRRHLTIDWDGSGNEFIQISQTRAMFDCSGRKTGIFDLPWTNENIESYKGDFTGNSVPDILFHTIPANEVYLFRNDYGRKIAGIPLGTGKNFTLY